MRIIRPVPVSQAGTFFRAGTGTYFDKNGVLQTAPADTLRITYDPSDLSKAPYAMVEAAATNRLLWSDDLSNAVWNKGGQTVAPATQTSAWTLTKSLALDLLLGQPVTIPNDSARYTFSISILKDNDETRVSEVALRLEGGTVAEAYVSLNTKTGASYLRFTTGGESYEVKDNGDEWRVSVSMSNNATGNTSVRPLVRAVIGPSLGVVDVTLLGAVTIRRPQLSDRITSYIPTTTATVTRPADVVNTTGLLYSNVPENDYPVWSATKVYSMGDRIIDTAAHKVYQSVMGTTGTVTMTIAAPAAFTMKDSTGAAYVPAAGTPIVFSTTGALPVIVAGTVYYVVSPTGTTFQIATTVGGSGISTSGGTQSGTHTATASNNYNTTAPNVTYWLDAGATNKWEMFDNSITSQTNNAGSVVVAFAPGQRLDSIVGLNLAASSGTVSVTDITTGAVVYSVKLNLVSNSNVQDMYSYMYEPIIQLPEFVLTDLPLGISNSSIITVTFNSTATVGVGGLVFGLQKDIGLTEWGAKVGTVDYSVKTKDAFGNYTITPRAFSKRGDFTVQVPTDSVDFLQNMLAQFRATPVVYIGSNSGKRTQFNSTIIYGFYRDFSLDIAYNAYSVCSISVEGLT